MRKRKRTKFNAELGFRVRQMRNLNKMPPDRLAEVLGVSTQTVQRYETGEIHMPPEAIGKCAKSLNTPVGYFYGEGDKYPVPSNTNKIGLLLAAEVMELPDDNIRKSLFHLVRDIIRWSEKRNSDAA